MTRRDLSGSQLLLRALPILVLLVVTPHVLEWSRQLYGPLGVLDTPVARDDVFAWFELFNSGSVLYIIIPFFIVEMVRYAWLRRMSLGLIGDSVVNIVTLVMFMAIEVGLGFVLLNYVYYWVHTHLSLPHLALTPISLVFLVLLADFAYYWDHRLMHRVGLGWATHLVHHSSPHFNMSVAYRFGPLDAVFPLLFSLPIVAAGYDPFVVLAAELFVQTFQAILHTEAIGKLPSWIERVFNTPSHHRVHHGSNRQYWDVNYAGVLIVWDRLFGTFEPEVEPVRFGVSVPVDSLNPLVVFFIGLVRLWRKMRTAPTVGLALRCLVEPPEWDPNPDAPTPVSAGAEP